MYKCSFQFQVKGQRLTIFAKSLVNELRIKLEIKICKYFFVEFDPGSGQTLAACIKHASRTEDKCCTS